MSSWLNQTDRLLQIFSAYLPPETLIPLYFNGTEYLSGLFKFEIDLISNDKNMDQKKILGYPLTLKVKTAQAERYFNGIVTSFRYDKISNGGRCYKILLEPWFALLAYTSNCRIFFNKSVVEIAEQIFTDDSLGFYKTFFAYNHEGLIKNYRSRLLCTQYRETSLNFMSRLFEEEGIAYYFDHSENKHILMLTDQNSSFKSCANQVVFDNGSDKNYGLYSWQRHYQFYSGKFAQNDYDYKKTGTSLFTQQQTAAKLLAANNFGHYDYPGRYAENIEGNYRTQQRFAAEEFNHELIEGSSNYLSFAAGKTFNLMDVPVPAVENNYVLYRVTHSASDESYLSGVQGKQYYRNQFICFPKSNLFRVKQSTPKPVINSVQTAKVIGLADAETYTNEYACVKIKFHWDQTTDKESFISAWVRVAQSMAGDGWGAQFMPRVGQEVVVTFLEGNPDQPLIIGSVYNSKNTPPYLLPNQAHQSGIKTRSIKNGGIEDFNELRFDDNNENEEIFIQAQKNFKQKIKNNLEIIIQNDHLHSTQNNSIVRVGNNYNHITTSSATIKVDKDFNHTTGENSKIAVGKDTVHSIGRNYNFNIGHDWQQKVQNDSGLSTGNNARYSIGNNYHLSVGNTANLQAVESFTIQVGASKLLINSEGIYINGSQVTINESI